MHRWRYILIFPAIAGLALFPSDVSNFTNAQPISDSTVVTRDTTRIVFGFPARCAEYVLHTWTMDRAGSAAAPGVADIAAHSAMYLTKRRGTCGNDRFASRAREHELSHLKASPRSPSIFVSWSGVGINLAVYSGIAAVFLLGMTAGRKPPTQTPTCGRCGYDLRGSTRSARCPECGTPINAAVEQSPPAEN